MIFDELACWRRYVPHRNASEFCQAIEFLRTFSPDIAVGKHVFKEGLIYANVQEYTPKKLAEGAMEYHRDFVDVQTLLAGSEYIYYSPLAGLTEKSAFDAEKDCGFYHFDPASALACKLQPGNFAMLFPEEGHMPCIECMEDPGTVKKVVLKIHRSIFE